MIAQLTPSYIKTRPLKAVSRLMSYVLFEGRPLTTRGRWINPLVFSLFRLARKGPRLKKVTKPIFIVGTGRSGTTILGVMLSMHPKVGFLNEPKAIWQFLYPYEDLIGNYNRNQAFYRLGEEEVDEEFKETAHRIYGAYLALTFSERVVDKYPELIFRVPFVRAVFPDAKFLFLVRNAYDTCSSVERWLRRNGINVNGERHDWWGANNRKWKLMIEQLVVPEASLAGIKEEMAALTRPTDMAAVEWVLTMREGLKLLGQYPDDAIKMVKYEDLVQNPREALLDLADFCELPYDARYLELGLKSLKPPPSKRPIVLHPKIQPLVEETLEQIGYNGKKLAQ
jgi:hypothetical protein